MRRPKLATTRSSARPAAPSFPTASPTAPAPSASNGSRRATRPAASKPATPSPAATCDAAAAGRVHLTRCRGSLTRCHRGVSPEVRQYPVEMTASFSNLSLAEPLARAVAEMGYESMTPIQAQAIPVVLTGIDVMGAAQTGTGKTAAFALPLLQRLLKHENTSTSPARHPVRALVLLPTRELADQVA